MYIIKYFFILLAFNCLSQNQTHFQTENLDWNLNRRDYTNHMVVGQISALVPMLIFSTRDDGINYTRGIIYGTAVSLTLTIGKEFGYDYLLNRGVASYPDMVYGTIGCVTGIIIGYGILKFVDYMDSKNSKLKL